MCVHQQCKIFAAAEKAIENNQRILYFPSKRTKKNNDRVQNNCTAKIYHSDDFIFEKNDVAVIIDEISLELIKGGTLDYTEELIGSYFQVINPNASSACGCGTSFSI